MWPPETIGGAARRAVSELPRPAWMLNARASVLPSASCPIDLVGLPPDWLQSAFATGGGRVIGRAAVAGSTVTSPSPVRTASRWPRTGVLGPLAVVNTPQPLAASAAAMITDTRK